MYNLLRVHNLKIYNTCALSKQVVTTPFRRSCSICSHITYTNFAVNDLTVCQLGRNGARHTSTFCNTHLISNELKKRKRYLKKRKQFTELLEIIGNGHSETVAKVKNLKPKDVSLLAENPSITLEHVHDVKINKTKNKKCLSMRDNKVVTDVEILHSNYGCDHEFMMNDTCLREESISDKHFDTCSEDTKNSSNDVNAALTEEVINDIQEEIHGLNSAKEVVTVLNDPVIKRDLLKEINNEKRYDSKIPISNATDQQKQPSKRKRNMSLSFTDKEELAKVKVNELNKKGKLQNVNSVLLAYIDTCVSCGFLNRALATLQYYVKRSKSNQSMLLPSDMKIFDSLLQGFATKGKVEKFQDVWSLVKYLKLKPTCNSYALQLECVARSTKDYHELQRVYQETLSEMNKEGITLNDLFQKSTFLGNQREVILEALHRLYPEHKPEITPPDLCYSCSLLQKLNEENASLLRSPVEGLFSSEELKKFGKEQFQYEIQGSVPIRSIEKRPDPSPFVQVYREKLATLKKMWEKDILKALERDINLMNAALNHTKSFKHSTLFPYLKVLTPEQYKDIIMQEICKLAERSESFSPTTFQLYRGLGLKVRSRYIVKYKQCHGILDKTQHLYEKYCDWYADPANQGQQSKNSRQEWQKLIFLNQEGPTINIDEKVWPTGILVSLGKFLYNIILHDIKIDVNVLRLTSQNQQLLPAFYTIFRQQSNHSVEEVKPHPILSKLIRATEPEELLFDVNFVPMTCPPLPWTSPDSGGYLIVKSDFLRLPCQALQQRERLESLPPSQLYPSFDSLNQLSCVPWMVNTKVLDTMIEVFNDGGSSKLEVPEPPSACPVPEPVTPEMSKVERYQVFKKRMAVRRKKAEMYSLWCDALYRLSLANHFRDRVFWLPHNMDFRGRVYPCPPHLNHLGSDLARSLLCFAKGKPLGDTGLDWLKIHVVNLTGLKKKNSVIERLLYANEIIDDIIDSAQKPLTGRMWWAESENPWQTLACCVEIWDAIQHPGGPESFVSHFPVHQDGSCNGLQHYAALGRDKDGAASVNLSPAIIPQDVYSCVAAIVEKERAADAANGLKVAQQLDGFIQRKVIKQTVMTTVYGVTRYGARLQIAKQLKDIEAFPKDYVWSASTYLVGKTFESLRQMFTSTREIQDWFTECARLISQVCGQNVEYVTPLGLPVVQPYTRRKLVSIPQTSLGHVDNTNLYSVDKFERPNVMKQKNAFPPNFIHSLDSSHMMLTSLFCEQQGITFVSVHDCYWTHPCTVHIMNKVCREQFVSLHSQPILEDLSAFLIDKFSYPEKELEDDPSNVTTAKLRLNHTLKKVPPKGLFQLENVMDSIYFFS